MMVSRSFILLFTLLLSHGLTRAWGQTITAGPDSTVIPTPTDTTETGFFAGLKNLDKPGRAALYSAIIPGGGQLYNKSYWKLPIIYAGGVTFGLIIADNHKKYLMFRSSYAALTDTSRATISQFTDRFKDRTRPFEEHVNFLIRNEDQYRRWRDLSIFFGVLFYGLNVAEAYVHAHLKDFNVSDELSLRVQPTLIPGPAFQYAPGVSVHLNLKN
jgi:hypothetical protein